MFWRKHIQTGFLAMILAIFITSGLFSQEKPGGHSALKIDVAPCFVNEARLSYEIPFHKKQSIVASAGFLYPNRFLYQFDQISDFYITTGGSLGLAYRYYVGKEENHRIFPMESYLHPELFVSHSRYQNEWFEFPGPDRNTPDEWDLVSSNFTQVGFRGLIGFQNRKGRFLTDLYFGLGFKTVFQNRTTHATTVGNGPVIDPTTTFPESTLNFTDYTATLHLGLKIGLRTGKSEQ